MQRAMFLDATTAMLCYHSVLEASVRGARHYAHCPKL